MITSQITASACQLGCPRTLLPPYQVALHRDAPDSRGERGALDV